jgi:hypothetical protein
MILPFSDFQASLPPGSAAGFLGLCLSSVKIQLPVFGLLETSIFLPEIQEPGGSLSTDPRHCLQGGRTEFGRGDHFAGLVGVDGRGGHPTGLGIELNAITCSF